MGHVNNAVYLDYLEEALAAAGPAAAGAISGTPRRIRLEYLVAAAPGAELVGETWPDAAEVAGTWSWRLADPSGRALARAQILPGA